MQATASTTASDGSTIHDCVTFYIDGPQTGIPDTTITGQLDSLYQQSKSYPPDGTATPNLMTGVAEHESDYAQFRTPAECNADLFNLDADYGVLAKWPYEPELAECVSEGGSHIGLMQVAIATDQTADPNAWKWADSSLAAGANANDAVNLFSGTVSPNKIQLASTYANDIIKPSKSLKLPAHVDLNPPTGAQLENIGLVLYRGKGLGPDLATTLRALYYIPVCPPPNNLASTIKGWTCTDSNGSSKWYWAVNIQCDPSSGPCADNDVQAQYIFPPGTTVGAFGNSAGAWYVSNTQLPAQNDPDTSDAPGVRAQLQ